MQLLCRKKIDAATFSRHKNAMKLVKSYIQMFALFALVMAGLSPACAFAGGNGLMTICKDDGSFAIVVVSPEMDPYFDPAFNPDAPADTFLEMPECTFCFAANHIPAMSAAEIYIPQVRATHNAQFYTAAHPVHWRNISAHNPRAPPLTFV